MAYQEAKTIKVEDARIIFRNFAGKEGPYNKEGERSFALILPLDLAEQMLADGWNVKYLDPREDGEDPTAYISVSIRFDVRPPRVVMLTSSTRTQLDEQSIEVLDWSDIRNVDIIIRGYDWFVASTGKSGTKAYLQTMFIQIEEDELERKYAIHEHPAGDFANE